MNVCRAGLLLILTAAFAAGETPNPQPSSSTKTGSRTEKKSDKRIEKKKAVRLLEQGRRRLREQGKNGARKAVVLFREALVADPECEDCWWELGWSYRLLGRWNASLRAWNQLRSLDPYYPELEVYYSSVVLAVHLDIDTLPPPELEPAEGPTLTLNAVGDVHMGRAWPEERALLPPNDAQDLLEGVKDLLSDADITFGNLETVLLDEGDSEKCGTRSTRCFAFRVPMVYSEALKDAGFDVLSIANNHAGDFGEAGRLATMKALDEREILHSGPVGDIASWDTKSLRIALIAFSTGANVYRVQEIEAAKKLVAQLDRVHDLVMVSFHGGAEGSGAVHVAEGVEMFLGENRGDLRRFAHSVIDAGADLVLGHGPHRLRAMEVYQGRLIAYSLGNFSSWKTFKLTGPLGTTGILKVELAANGVLLRAEMIPVTIADPGRPQPDPENDAIETVRALSLQDFGHVVLDEKGVYERPETGAQ